MKYGIFFLLLFTLPALAQSTAGLTGKRDTSYTNYSAYQSTRKKYPDIQLVESKLPPSVTEQKDLVYCRYGSRALYLDVFYPKKRAARPIPAILIIHGGGWRTGDRSQHIPLAHRLAALGYVTITAEYRLSTEALYPAAIHDLKAAIRWMRSQATAFNIDTTQIASLGFSAGGQLAALLGTTNGLAQFEGKECTLQKSSRVQAIIDMDGILAFIHPESGEGDDSRATSAATHWFGYSKIQNPKLWQEASALTYVNHHTPPTLFINSSVDRMHAGRDDFRAKLAEFNIYSQMHTFPDSPHSFCLFHPWFEPTVKYIADFLEKVFVKQ